VRIVVDRWAAGIKSHHSPSGVDGREGFSLTSEGVVERE
jgi:Na+-transporting NADH:ubiquinone oxidoreductase subunit NqrC